jgi:hypothetical protein
MTVDFDLHGIALLRVVDPPPAAVAAVTADTGLRPGPPCDRAPDLLVTFGAELTGPEPLRHVGRDAGFSGQTFVLGGQPGGRVEIPLDSLDDSPLLLRCEPNVRYVPHLVVLLNLAMLRRGWLPLHAGAVVHDGRGIVATGWSKGGKTESVLGLMAAGAHFVADEWCYVDPRTKTVLGLRHPVRVWEWQLRQLPSLRRTLSLRQRIRLALTRGLMRIDAFREALAPTLGVSYPPERLFGKERLTDRMQLDELVLVEAWDAPDISSRPIEAAEVAARMRASLQDERARLHADQKRLAFAFPERRAAHLAAIDEREAQLLDAAFAGVPARLVSHPYPVDLAALARVVGAS